MKNVFYQLFEEDLTRVSLMFEKGTPYEAAVNRLVDEEEKLLATLNAETIGFGFLSLNSLYFA